MPTDIFPPTIKDQLQQVWQQLAGEIAVNVLVLTPEDWPQGLARLQAIASESDPWEEFLLLLSTDFSALVVLRQVTEGYQLGLILDISVIQKFTARGPKHFPVPHHNQPVWQSRLALLLLEKVPRAAESIVCHPIQLSLHQQINEDQILYEVVTQIRQTLELPAILKHTVDKVQNYLQVDRLVIYQFDPRQREADAVQQRTGLVAYESRIDDSVPSVLNFREPQGCFDDFKSWQRYNSGATQVVPDVAAFYRQHECFAQQMHQFQVRAKLVVPIRVGGYLWGLLIAHDCHQPYAWQPWQSRLLQRVAEHLEIAIKQAELYGELQGQKTSLEMQVRRQTQDLRDALTVAQAANDAKTEFLAMLSHELRTPLTSILGLSYTLLNLLGSNLDDRQKGYLQTIKHSGDHLLELIDDMLEISQLEAGRAVLRVSEFSVMKMLHYASQVVRQQADFKKILLRIEVMDGEEDVIGDPLRDIRFRGDIKRIRQICLNLLTNAIKFTESQGEIVLRAWREYDYLVVQVEDSGIGIPQTEIPQIFYKFRQLNSHLDREQAGLGLGLTLTKQLVELHGGWIEVESEEGKGSTFTVWLATQNIRAPKLPAPPHLYTVKTIVLVECDHNINAVVADILTAAGYQVVSLTETYLAHKQIELWQPDLVIIGQAIGEKYTNQILRYLHNQTDSQHIRYLLIDTQVPAVAIESVIPVDRLLWDPVQPEKLLDKINKLV